MGTILASVLFEKVGEILQDTGFVTYTAAQLLSSLNDGQRAIVLVRPDAKSARETVALTVGQATQTLPAGAMRLGGILRNMGVSGSTVGRAITGPVPRETLDAIDPLWAVTTGTYVKQYVYNEADPAHYDVYPPVASAWQVELLLFRVPTDVASSSAAIDLDDIYAPALIEWMAYRNFARDSERTPNYVRAGRHFANFFQLLGVKTRGDMAVSPKVLENDKQLQTATR